MRSLLHTPFVIALLLACCMQGAAAAQEPRLAEGYWTRGLAGGWGQAWKHGVPGYGKTESEVRFAAFHPQLGRFVTDHLELYGEGTLLVYRRPTPAVSAGLAGLGGRYHFWRDRSWTPYAVGIAGLLWTSLDVPEVDRVFNFQLVYGVGIRVVPPRGPGLLMELRNHHISNAGTAGQNLGPERRDGDRRRAMAAALTARPVSPQPHPASEAPPQTDERVGLGIC